MATRRERVLNCLARPRPSGRASPTSRAGGAEAGPFVPLHLPPTDENRVPGAPPREEEPGEQDAGRASRGVGDPKERGSHVAPSWAQWGGGRLLCFPREAWQKRVQRPGRRINSSPQGL